MTAVYQIEMPAGRKEEEEEEEAKGGGHEVNPFNSTCIIFSPFSFDLLAVAPAFPKIAAVISKYHFCRKHLDIQYHKIQPNHFPEDCRFVCAISPPPLYSVLKALIFLLEVV